MAAFEKPEQGQNDNIQKSIMALQDRALKLWDLDSQQDTALQNESSFHGILVAFSLRVLTFQRALLFSHASVGMETYKNLAMLIPLSIIFTHSIAY